MSFSGCYKLPNSNKWNCRTGFDTTDQVEDYLQNVRESSKKKSSNGCDDTCIETAVFSMPRGARSHPGSSIYLQWKLTPSIDVEVRHHSHSSNDD